MAEYAYSPAQAVDALQNVLFNETIVDGGKNIAHRVGSGIVTLRGITNAHCRARYKVSFGANIAIPTGGTVGDISVALAINGEPLAASTAIVTPAAVEQFFNVYVAAFVDVPNCCCVNVAVENTTGETITVQNANIIVERVA